MKTLKLITKRRNIMLSGGRKYTLMWATIGMMLVSMVAAMWSFGQEAELFSAFLLIWTPTALGTYGMFTAGNTFEHKFKNSS